MITSIQLKEIKDKKFNRESLMILYSEKPKVSSSPYEVPVISSEVVSVRVAIRRTLYELVKQEKGSIKLTKDILFYYDHNNKIYDITYSLDYAVGRIGGISCDGGVLYKELLTGGGGVIGELKQDWLSYDLLIAILEAIEKNKFI